MVDNEYGDREAAAAAATYLIKVLVRQCAFGAKERATLTHPAGHLCPSHLLDLHGGGNKTVHVSLWRSRMCVCMFVCVSGYHGNRRVSCGI